MSKKAGKSQKEQSSYEVRDIVLAKVRGFPPWPGMVSVFLVNFDPFGPYRAQRLTDTLIWVSLGR
jgi:hypothetical protein